MKAKDIRKGKVVIFKDAPHVVLEFQHRTPGNLRAFVQAKLRNVMTGVQTETRFSSTEEISIADVYSFKATYLYHDAMGYHFMNAETFEEVVLTPEIIGDFSLYLHDGIEVSVSTYNETPISVTPPKTVTLTIADTTPELRGATANNSPKPAKTDTGLSILVPAFLKIGDRVVVDTEEGVYLSRAD